MTNRVKYEVSPLCDWARQRLQNIKNNTDLPLNFRDNLPKDIKDSTWWFGHGFTFYLNKDIILSIFYPSELYPDYTSDSYTKFEFAVAKENSKDDGITVLNTELLNWETNPKRYDDQEDEFWRDLSELIKNPPNC